ncbi:MAG: hypothetical protein LBC13_01805 [Clostridiales bacterium]|jgi:hypothetical protein|nr:hypothetical protein [Clostridiales bacterium]
MPDEQKLACPHCGAKDGITRQSNGECSCLYCRLTFFVETAENAYEEVYKALDAQKQDTLNHAYTALWNALKPLHPDNGNVVSCAQRIIEFDADHLFANLYQTVFADSNIEEIRFFLKKAQVTNAAAETCVKVAECFIKYFKLSYYDDLKAYITAAIVPKDEAKGEALLIDLEKRFKDESDGVFDCKLARDAFVSYKSEEKTAR